ncbi:MAG TPA: hypothetical protein VMS77_02875 [Conexivisphaerales archaeon]|nr:hypothetical protein [Conexivisphaerales archaeon]
MTPEDSALLDRMISLTRTKATAVNYKSYVLKLAESEGITLAELLALEPRAVEDRLLDFYLKHRDWTRSRMSVLKCAVVLFGEANGEKEYTFKRLKRALPVGNQKPRDRSPTIEEGRTMLKHADIRERALLLTVASSGLRRGALGRAGRRHPCPLLQSHNTMYPNPARPLVL